MLQGEAFVPESIVRFGTREKGRDGVHTLKAEDNRIKWVAFSKSLIVSNCEHPWKLQFKVGCFKLRTSMETPIFMTARKAFIYGNPFN